MWLFKENKNCRMTALWCTKRAEEKSWAPSGCRTLIREVADLLQFLSYIILQEIVIGCRGMWRYISKMCLQKKLAQSADSHFGGTCFKFRFRGYLFWRKCLCFLCLFMEIPEYLKMGHHSLQIPPESSVLFVLFLSSIRRHLINE
jgi:hypothetical protein